MSTNKVSSQKRTFDEEAGFIDHPQFGVIMVRRTNDYGRFKTIKSNRNLNLGHVNSLFKSISEQELFTLIYVNELYEPIDGIHRIAAFEKAQKPICYAIISGYGENELARYNNNLKNWSYEDYIHHYCVLGNVNYIEYAKFKAKYGMGHHTNIILLSGWMVNPGKSVGEKFKQGKFVINDLEGAKKKASMLKQLNFYPGWNSRSFVFAFLEVLAHPNFKFYIFLEKFKKRSSWMLEVGGEKKHYLKAMEKIYNYGSRKRVAIYNHLDYI